MDLIFVVVATINIDNNNPVLIMFSDVFREHSNNVKKNSNGARKNKFALLDWTLPQCKAYMISEILLEPFTRITTRTSCKL